MALLQVRDCPNDLYKDLADFAKSENRSISQQTIYILKNALGDGDQKKLRRRKALEAFSENTIVLPDDAKAPEELIREDRNR
jgi:hypothetical protein